MNPDDKLKEAIKQAFELEKAKAYKCCESCGINFSNADTYFHYGFLAGAAYIRETEVAEIKNDCFDVAQVALAEIRNLRGEL